ncbi:U1 zinc finger-domain-containing protein [Rhypophila decipiens]|uniref:U1 small nuclear ribonucleoprotein C n=1 Tax=Rhypophila decipiens TaxID=261697 RepID=A0AAN7BFH9_9PEZI|nr:U1 zinc finger-domain-containing protein [Rhypophila decipiens]
MPKFFCDYCDVYLTHDSMSVRKAHNSGRNHLRNVVDYYQQIGHEKAQSVIDSITSSYAAEGQAHNNPMLPQNAPGGIGAGLHAPFPPPGGVPPPFNFGPGGLPPPPCAASRLRSQCPACLGCHQRQLAVFLPSCPPAVCPSLHREVFPSRHLALPTFRSRLQARKDSQVFLLRILAHPLLAAKATGVRIPRSRLQVIRDPLFFLQVLRDPILLL